MFYVLQIAFDGNETAVISSVTFAPVPEDDGTVLKCKGDNPKLPGVSQSDTITLNVVCKLRFESNFLQFCVL